MELIDRQDAITAIDHMLMEDERYKVWLKLSIKNIKPVDAVPIEVIERYREKLIRIRDMFQPHTMQWESVDGDICVVGEILKYSQKGKNDATD